MIGEESRGGIVYASPRSESSTVRFACAFLCSALSIAWYRGHFLQNFNTLQSGDSWNRGGVNEPDLVMVQVEMNMQKRSSGACISPGPEARRRLQLESPLSWPLWSYSSYYAFPALRGSPLYGAQDLCGHLQGETFHYRKRGVRENECT